MPEGPRTPIWCAPARVRTIGAAEDRRSTGYARSEVSEQAPQEVRTEGPRR